MSEIAFIQPTAPQAPPPSQPPAGSDSRAFSPHLDKAIASKNDQSSSRESSSKRSEGRASDSKQAGNSDRIPQKEAAQPQKPGESEAPSQGNGSTGEIANNSATDQTTSQDQTDTAVLSRYLAGNEQLFAFLSQNTTSNTTEKGEHIPAGQNFSANSSMGSFSTSTLTETLAASIARTDSPLPVAEVTESQSTNNALLAQIQKIISESGESGRASITVTDNTLSKGAPLPLTITSSEFAANQIDTSEVLLSTGPEGPIDKASQDITSMRHSIRQQYYEGKILPQTGQENQSSLENNQQSDSFSPNAKTGEEPHTLSTVTTEQSSTFSQPLSLIQAGQKQSTVQIIQPVILPSGTIIQQEEVIRQITEHLQLARRDNDTRVNIKLHPEELGELKINLSVKEGVVRATVVASSIYAHEILEKNVTKLKTTLESQGFTIGEISVSSKSDTVEDFSHFDRQLFSQNSYTPPSTKNSRSFNPLFTLENASVSDQETVAGVNVKI